MKKLNIILLLLILTILIKPNISRSTINSIVLTPANPTIMSTGLGYYLAGRTYNFDIQVIDPDVTAWNQITLVRLQIPNSTLIDIQVGPLTGAAQVVTVTSGGVSVANITPAGTYNNFTITFAITFLWNMPESAWAAGNTLTATASSNNPAANSLNTTQNVSFGVCSTISALNLAMDGEAADGRVTRWHDTFNITANAIVYNVPGAAATDEVNARTPGEMTATVARFDANSIGNDIAPPVTINMPAGQLNTWLYTFNAVPIISRFRATMTTGAATVDTNNSLNLYCNEVRVANLSFIGGGGVDTPPEYYKGVNIPGTQVRIDADIRGGGAAMEGNTTFEVYNTTNNQLSATVVIPNGQFFAIAALTYPFGAAAIPANETVQKLYEIRNVYGGVYGNAASFGQYNNDPTRINQAFVQRYIYWNNLHWPGSTPNPGINAAFYNSANLITDNIATPTATSFTLSWSITSLASPPNGDFSSYKIYFKKNTDIIYNVVDKNTVGYAALGTISPSTVTITGLEPFTVYNYRLSAYDVFGNEVNINNQPTNTALTDPSIFVSVSDGITTYPYTSFIESGFPSRSKDPAALPLRKTAIKISAVVITAGNIPDEVAIILANNNTDADLSYPFPGCAPTINQYGGFAPGCSDGKLTNDNILLASNYTIILSKSATNTWSGYIPSDHPLITLGTSIRFIVRTKIGGTYGYADLKAYSSALNPPPGNWWNAEYRFQIASQPTFTPWPVRILNNVMNTENPICYPAYYLTDDAYVTISVFDLKGRPVVTLVDNQLRKGGQNIKEGGWDGSNKGARKIGVGIYYVRFYATRAADGKVILNEFKKVVMAR